MDTGKGMEAVVEAKTSDGRWKLFSRLENGREIRTIEHSSQVHDAKFSTVILSPRGEVVDVDDWQTKEEAKLGHALMVGIAEVMP